MARSASAESRGWLANGTSARAWFRKCCAREREIAGAIREARQRDLDAANAPVEIVAEGLGVDHRGERLVRGGDDANVDIDRLARADRQDLPAFQRAQELHLKRELEVTDLVEKQRPAARLDEETTRIRRGAREGASLVTEERRLEERGARAHRN